MSTYYLDNPIGIITKKVTIKISVSYYCIISCFVDGRNWDSYNILRYV